MVSSLREIFIQFVFLFFLEEHLFTLNVPFEPLKIRIYTDLLVSFSVALDIKTNRKQPFKYLFHKQLLPRQVVNKL